MVTYDPNILQEFADNLYHKANRIVSSFTLLGAMLGGGAGLMMGRSGLTAIIGLLLCGFFGAAVGRARAFQFKLQAQLTLCQKSIEENCRRNAPGAQLARPDVAQAA